MSVTPAALPNIDATANWNAYEYRHRTTGTGVDAGKEIYDMWEPTGAHWVNAANTYYSIYVDTATNTWYDYGTNANPVNVNESNGEISLMDAGNVALLYKFTKPTTASWISGSGSGSGSGRQTFSSGQSGIINVEFNKLTDSSIELGFDWQGINVYQVYVDRGGTETWSQHSLTGADGTVTGYTGAGANALTGLNEGDRVWVNNATDADGRLPVYVHSIVEWSKEVVSGTKSVIAKCFGESGFQFRISNTLGENTQYVSHTGNELSLSASLPSPGKKVIWQVWKYKASPITLAKYGSSFTTYGGIVSQNFW